MGLWKTVVGAFGGGTPAVEAAPGVPRVQASSRAPYETGVVSAPRTRGWARSDFGPVAATGALDVIRARARDATRNDGLAKAIVEAWVTDVVGWGFTPRSRAKDPVLRANIQALWALWAETAGAQGEDFAELTCAVVREVLTSGEIFVRLRPRKAGDGLAVPLALELVDPARVPHMLTQSVEGGGSIVQGVERDQIGRVVAYHILDQVPGEPVIGTSNATPRRIPATSVLHVFDRTRAGQARGVSALTQSLARLRALDAWDDATLQRLQISAPFAGFLKRPSGAVDSTANPLTGLAADGTHEGRDVVMLDPGIMQELAPGEELEFSEPPDPPAAGDFSKQQLRAACAAAGIPLEVVTGDWTGQNDRIARITLSAWHRRVYRFTWSVVIPRLLRPTWRTFIGLSGVTGPVGDASWKQAVWAAPAFPYVNPSQEIAAQVAAIRGGLVPRSSVIAEATGEDAELVDAAIAEDQARADKLGLKLDSDGRQSKGGGQ